MSIQDQQVRIRENVANVRAAIENACQRANRRPAEILLVAATKYVDARTIRLLMDAGIRDFGENRVQQLQQRVVELGTSLARLDHHAPPDLPRWHMIGHLQRNKVKPLLGCARIVQSVDSLRLAQEVEKHAAEGGEIVDVLVEANISGEISKEGISPAEVPELIVSLHQLPHLRPCGLMTMAPLTGDQGVLRAAFAGLRELMEKLREAGDAGPDFRHLSMGMSHDFEIAIEEGSTIVRVGSRLFEGILPT